MKINGSELFVRRALPKLFELVLGLLLRKEAVEVSYND